MTRRIRTLEPIGMALDLPPNAVPKDQWTGATNVSFGQGMAARTRGHKIVFGTPLFPPRWLLNIRTPQDIYWLYAGDTGYGVVDTAGLHTDITGPVFDTTGLPNPHTGGLIEGLAAVSNDVTEPTFWDSTTGSNMQVLPDWPVGDICGALRPFREFLIAMDVFASGQRLEQLVRWSDAAPPGDVPQSWTPAVDSLAGEFSLGYLPGRIVDGLTLRQSFMLYKRHSTWQMDLIGGQFVFAQRPVFTTLGMLTPNCAVEFRGKHFVLSDGDVAVHDGTTAESIADQRVRRMIFSSLSETQFRNSWAAIDKQAGEIWLGIPEAGAIYATKALIWSIRENQWGIRELTHIAHGLEGIVLDDLDEPTWDTSTQIWSEAIGRWSQQGLSAKEETLLLAEPGGLDERGQPHRFDLTPKLLAVGGETVEEAIMISGVERTGLDFGEPDLVKSATRIFPHIEGPRGDRLFVRAGASLTSESPISWQAERIFLIGIDEAVDVDVQGRYLAFAFRSVAIGAWRMTGFDVELAARGRW